MIGVFRSSKHKMDLIRKTKARRIGADIHSKPNAGGPTNSVPSAQGITEMGHHLARNIGDVTPDFDRLCQLADVGRHGAERNTGFSRGIALLVPTRKCRVNRGKRRRHARKAHRARAGAFLARTAIGIDFIGPVFQSASRAQLLACGDGSRRRPPSPRYYPADHLSGLCI